ncbi:MAG: DEAD/DEAH box helicase family protein [Zoogloeaceae bacterium]|jgi:type III restriction enzyme|nr:DEAD/DEAH box helicase family protein [Zoogloeaceae bacterium]
MRTALFPFQETALADLHEKIQKAHTLWSEKDPQVISFSAPTGAGKTIIMAALFEEIFFGHAGGVAAPDSVFVWLSDMPELNEQTRLKIESKADKFYARNIRLIDSAFDAAYFAPGIYFLNTQKLGADKRLIQKGDRRQYTIWETLANTAARCPKSFYVVIDEAHRGTFTPREENKAQSIMQKFILGSKEDGLPVMPLVIGVSATPQRFQRLVDSATKSAIQKVVVPPEDVRESGLLKDRIIIHFPDAAARAGMTIFKEAVTNWKRKRERWAAYCEREEIENVVRPILVVQVEDGGGREVTRTNLGECVAMIEESLGRKLQAGEAVHTFDKHENITMRDLEIRHIDASRIEEDEKVMVVFFKMNLSTGWDCPRAETMMSFRSASDYTYIAQLLGRMIRTPLARRVESDAELNNVALFLPFFDAETVKKVEGALRDSEAIVSAETGSYKELITLERNPAFADVFAEMDLVTYRMDAARKQPALRRVIALARALTHDMIAPEARKNALDEALDTFDKEIAALKESGKFDEIAKAVTELSLRTMTIDYGGDTADAADDDSARVVELSEPDLDNLFERAGKILGEGLHKEYWVRHGVRDAADVKTEIIVMTNDNAAMARIEAFSGKRFNEIYDKHRATFRKLKEERQEVYRRLARSSADPVPISLALPESIDFTVGDASVTFEKHLYIPSDGGEFRVSLNDWESDLVREELRNGALAWLRNLDRKKWSLEIPYKVGGVMTSMFPDLLVVRVDACGYVFDVLEPHDPSRKDNYPKAVGLADFAEKHGDRFGRIQLIRKKRGADGRDHFYRLDMGKLGVRNKVRGVTSNAELDRIFDADADTEET